MTLTDEDLRELAEGAAQLARDQEGADGEEGEVQVGLALDTSALIGGENPAWGNNGVAGGWVAPVAALAVDQGWLDGEQYGPKSSDPAEDAADRFAELLTEEGLVVQGEVGDGEAPTDAPAVQVQSAPLSEIVRHALLTSDNTTSELLAHLVADARGEETTPQGAAAAVEAEIRDLGRELGLPEEDLEAIDLRDGSGLSRDSRVPAGVFSAVLAEIASGEVPTLEQILFDVPVAGLSGTLSQRFEEDGTQDAAGLVRGKTGYLGGVATLAGVVVLPDGRTAGYAIMVHGFDGSDAEAARAVVDRVATQMVEPA